MKSEASSSFWKTHEKLNKELQILAKQKYEIWKVNSNHPSLQFKCVNAKKNIWSIRISESHRAIGIRPDHDYILWFWIGDHDTYMKLIS